MAFDQSRIDRIKQDPDSKFNKYLKREIQLDVLENEDLPVPYEHSDFITQFEYEAYSNYEFNLKKVSDIVKDKDPLKRLYYDEILENVKVVDTDYIIENFEEIIEGIYGWREEGIIYEKEYLIHIATDTTTKPDWHTGNKTISYSDYPSHQNLIGYKDTMVEKLKTNSGILIFPQGYKAFSMQSFERIGYGDILKSLKITDGVEALNEFLTFSGNYSLSDLYISTTLKEEINLNESIRYSEVKDFFIPSNITKLPYMNDLYRDGINSIVIHDSSNGNSNSFFKGIKSSDNLKKLYVIKTKTPDRETVEQAEMLKDKGVEVKNVTEQEAFEIMGYDYDLYLKKKKDGIPEYSWGEVKPEQYNPSFVISKNLDPLMLEISTLEKNNDKLLERDIDTIKNSYESIIKGYEDAIKKLQTIEEYNLNTIDESGNILKYIEFLKGRINRKLKVLQYNKEKIEEIENLEEEKKTLQDKIDAYTNVDKNLIIQNSLNIFKTFIGVHKDDIEEDEFYIFCLSTAYERLQNIDGIKLNSDDISRYFLVSEAQRVLTQSKEETLYEKGLKLTRHYATRGGKDE